MLLSSQVVGAAASSSSLGALPEPPANSSGMYKLDVELKRGHNLAVRDRGGALPPASPSARFSRFSRICDVPFWLFPVPGSSDPYVKFKLAGKEVFRSKTIHKNLNPVWDQKTSLVVDSLSEPVYVKVRAPYRDVPPSLVHAGVSRCVCVLFLRCLTMTLASKTTSWVLRTSTWRLWSSRGTWGQLA